MMGREKLALQGLFVTDEVTEHFTDRCLADLAGNALCSAKCLVALIIVLCGLGRGDATAEVEPLDFNPFEWWGRDSD